MNLRAPYLTLSAKCVRHDYSGKARSINTFANHQTEVNIDSCIVYCHLLYTQFAHYICLTRRLAKPPHPITLFILLHMVEFIHICSFNCIIQICYNDILEAKDFIQVKMLPGLVFSLICVLMHK